MKKSLGAKTLLYPTPVFIIGTYDKDGKPNGMTAAWAGVSCSSPPSVVVSVTKARHSYKNLMDRKAFTVNIPSEKHVKEADYFGMASGTRTDKFKETGLTPVKSEVVDAPYIKECPVVLECQVTHTLEVGIHTQFVGEIKDVKADEEILNKSGVPDIEKLKPLIFNPGTRAYHSVGSYVADAFSCGKRDGK